MLNYFKEHIMTYKNLLLIALLAPLSILGNEKELQLLELKFKKEAELSELGKTIADKYLYIRSIWKEEINIFKRQIEKAGYNDEEAKEFGRLIDEKLDAFIEVFSNEKNINGFLVKELFQKSENKQMEVDFDAIKFFLIIIRNEYRIIKTLIEGYEILEQQYREINQKFIALNQ